MSSADRLVETQINSVASFLIDREEVKIVKKKEKKKQLNFIHQFF